MVDATAPNPTAFTTEVLGATAPSRGQLGDVEFGWPLLRQISVLGIGHAMVVRERDVIAVAATETTVATVERAGALCRRRGWVLLETAGRDPDEVVPMTVDTIDALARAGGGCVAVAVDRLPIADKPAVIEAADRARIAVVAIREDRRGPAASG